jgi:hypothetical protein
LKFFQQNNLPRSSRAPFAERTTTSIRESPNFRRRKNRFFLIAFFSSTKMWLLHKQIIQLLEEETSLQQPSLMAAKVERTTTVANGMLSIAWEVLYAMSSHAIS